VKGFKRERYEKLKREPGKELLQHTQKHWKQGCEKKNGRGFNLNAK